VNAKQFAHEVRSGRFAVMQQEIDGAVGVIWGVDSAGKAEKRIVSSNGTALLTVGNTVKIIFGKEAIDCLIVDLEFVGGDVKMTFKAVKPDEECEI